VGGESEEFTCRSALRTSGDPTQEAWLRPATPAADGTVPITLQAFGWMEASGEDSCEESLGEIGFLEPEAEAWGYGGADIRNLHGAEATALLTPAQLAAPNFTLTLTAPPFPAACQSAPESEGGTTYAADTRFRGPRR
jgi:hypothetical protein